MMGINEASRDPPNDISGNSNHTENHYVENPTREYFNSFRKIELQKLCRQLGLPKVYQTKQRLAEMLLHAHRTQESTQDEASGTEHSTVLMNKVLKELEEIKETWL